ncbi:hypothetical protein [Petrachloros mirabilis]
MALLLDAASKRINVETLLGQTSTDVPALLQTALVLGLAYLLGIIVDKFAKWVMENLCGWLIGQCPVKALRERWSGLLGKLRGILSWNQDKKKPDAYLPKYAYVVISEGDPMSDLLFVRSKVRILRASAIILPLITVTAWPFLKNHYRCELELRVLLIALGILISVLAIWGYRYISGLYDNRLEQFYIALKRKELREAKN